MWRMDLKSSRYNVKISSYNLGREKIRNKTTPPPILWWTCAKAKTRMKERAFELVEKCFIFSALSRVGFLLLDAYRSNLVRRLDNGFTKDLMWNLLSIAYPCLLYRKWLWARHPFSWRWYSQVLTRVLFVWVTNISLNSSASQETCREYTLLTSKRYIQSSRWKLF